MEKRNDKSCKGHPAWPFRAPAGFDPKHYRIVVVKSANHFRTWYTDASSAIIDCDPPGIASGDLSTIKYAKNTRKVYPLDADAVYPEPASK